MTHDEERLLLLRIKKDPGNFETLFDLYYKVIFNYIFRRVADYDVSRDIASETFLEAYLNINSFVCKNVSILSWFYRIATNEINYHFRKTKNHPISLDKLFENDKFEQSESYDYFTEKELFENELCLHNDFLRIQQNLIKLDLMLITSGNIQRPPGLKSRVASYPGRDRGYWNSTPPASIVCNLHILTNRKMSPKIG